MKYVVITPARNEETFIEKTIRSMTVQTRLPVKWVVVDDGSTDRTPDILRRHAEQHPWIQVVTRPRHLERSFAGKVHAFNAGLDAVRPLDFEVVGNLDADLSFEPDYFEFLMGQFATNSTLGVAGTPFTQDNDYDSARDSFEGENYVAGGIQMFRRKCFEDIGGYVANAAGGVDWIAVMAARMKGWSVRSFAEKRFHHYRKLGTAERSQLSAIFSYGERAYYLGSSPLWHSIRCLYRMTKRPWLLGGTSLLLGYAWAMARRVPRPVSPEMIRYCRRDQMSRLLTIFGSLFRLRKVDRFHLQRDPKGIRSASKG